MYISTDILNTIMELLLISVTSSKNHVKIFSVPNLGRYFGILRRNQFHNLYCTLLVRYSTL